MTVEIRGQGNPFYYEIMAEAGEKLLEHQQQFDELLRSEDHPFRLYTEFVDEDGTISFAGHVNAFGADDFINWVNVEIYSARVARKVKSK